MRSRWEERWAEREKGLKRVKDEDQDGPDDEPVTITERQLRHLKIGATAGLVAVVLAFAATGLAAWSLMKAPDEAEVTTASTEGESAVPQAGMAPAVNPAGAPPASPAPQPTVGAAQPVQPAPTAAAAKPAPTTVKAATPSAKPAARRVSSRTSGTSRGTPVTIPATSLAPQPSTSSPPPVGITPPVPSTPAPSKPDSAR